MTDRTEISSRRLSLEDLYGEPTRMWSTLAARAQRRADEAEELRLLDPRSKVLLAIMKIAAVKP